MGKRINVVFEGGGIKGIGLVGALKALEEAGYEFGGIAGTSAGAIVAALLACGYNAAEMRDVLDDTDYMKFRQKGWLDRLGPAGIAVSVLLNYGMYSADYFEEWLNGLLDKKGVRKFGDIREAKSARAFQKYRFQAIASDITSRRFLVLPDDLRRFGYDIDSFSVARAVRMSMSLPVFFEPVKLKDKIGRNHIIADGGLLSNYPLWLFDSSPSETVGIRFRKSTAELNKMLSTNPINSFWDYLRCIIDTMLEAHDKQHIHTSNGDFGKTVFISSAISTADGLKEIKSTYFDITKAEADMLYQNGKSAAERFLARRA